MQNFCTDFFRELSQSLFLIYHFFMKMPAKNLRQLHFDQVTTNFTEVDVDGGKILLNMLQLLSCVSKGTV